MFTDLCDLDTIDDDPFSSSVELDFSDKPITLELDWSQLFDVPIETSTSIVSDINTEDEEAVKSLGIFPAEQKLSSKATNHSPCIPIMYGICFSSTLAYTSKNPKHPVRVYTKQERQCAIDRYRAKKLRAKKFRTTGFKYKIRSTVAKVRPRFKGRFAPVRLLVAT